METIKHYQMLQRNADTFTPIGLFMRLKGDNKFLLESSFQHESKGRYSYIGANPYKIVTGNGTVTTVYDVKTNETNEYPYDAITYLKNHLPKLDCPFPLTFTGGAIGYVAYDSVRQIYDIGKELDDPLQMPDYHFMLYDTIIVYEHLTEKLSIIAMNIDNVSEKTLVKRINIVHEQINRPVTINEPKIPELQFHAETPKEAFIEKVTQAKNAIERGEVEQVVLSQRLVADFNEDPLSFYRHLRSNNPSPYMFYIDFGDYTILGASPESLVHTSGRHVVTNPIAGTKPRGRSPEQDEALKQELTTDKKELAEHEMLVQLSKNDLRSVCEAESIHVPTYKDVVFYEHVMHLVSEVHGTLQKGKQSLDALRACLPAGTLSGFPKLRAMQMINELETKRRGFYGGGVGYISFKHDINFAISIRSLVIKNKEAFVQTGAGIVRDSKPENEYDETIHKAKSITNVVKDKQEETVK